MEQFVKQDLFNSELDKMKALIESLQNSVSNNLIIQSGLLSCTDDEEHVSSENSRTFIINFARPYRDRPQIQVSFKDLDLRIGSGICRGKLDVVDLTNEGFKLKVSTWSDSFIYFGQTTINWVSYGI